MTTNIVNINQLSFNRYKRMARFIDLFSQVTLISTYVYLTDHTFIGNNHILTDRVSLQEHIPSTGNDVFCVFPIVTSNSVLGFTICNTTTLSSQRIRLLKTALENQVPNILQHNNIVPFLLNPIFINSISRFCKMTSVFSTTNLYHKYRFSKQNKQSYEVNSDDVTDAVIKFIQMNINQPIPLRDIANKMKLSSSYISLTFKNRFHISITEYMTNLRIKKACDKLLTSHKSIRQISEETGYAQTSYFSRVFKEHIGLSPLQYRQVNQLERKA